MAHLAEGPLIFSTRSLLRVSDKFTVTLRLRPNRLPRVARVIIISIFFALLVSVIVIKIIVVVLHGVREWPLDLLVIPLPLAEPLTITHSRRCRPLLGLLSGRLLCAWLSLYSWGFDGRLILFWPTFAHNNTRWQFFFFLNFCVFLCRVGCEYALLDGGADLARGGLIARAGNSGPRRG